MLQNILFTQTHSKSRQLEKPTATWCWKASWVLTTHKILVQTHPLHLEGHSLNHSVTNSSATNWVRKSPGDYSSKCRVKYTNYRFQIYLSISGVLVCVSVFPECMETFFPVGNNFFLFFFLYWNSPNSSSVAVLLIYYQDCKAVKDCLFWLEKDLPGKRKKSLWCWSNFLGLYTL